MTAKTGQNAVKGPVKGTITAVEAGDETGVNACPDSLAFLSAPLLPKRQSDLQAHTKGPQPLPFDVSGNRPQAFLPRSNTDAEGRCISG